MSENKIYYGIRKVPKGYRRGNMKEAIEAHQVRYFGEKKIDPKLIQDAEVKENMTLDQINKKAPALKKKIEMIKIEYAKNPSKALETKFKKLAEKYNEYSRLSKKLQAKAPPKDELPKEEPKKRGRPKKDIQKPKIEPATAKLKKAPEPETAETKRVARYSVTRRATEVKPQEEQKKAPAKPAIKKSKKEPATAKVKKAPTPSIAKVATAEQVEPQEPEQAKHLYQAPISYTIKKSPPVIVDEPKEEGKKEQIKIAAKKFINDVNLLKSKYDDKIKLLNTENYSRDLEEYNNLAKKIEDDTKHYFNRAMSIDDENKLWHAHRDFNDLLKKNISTLTEFFENIKPNDQIKKPPPKKKEAPITEYDDKGKPIKNKSKYMGFGLKNKKRKY